MSIQNKRVEYLTELLLKKNLQDGILPDSKEFIWQLNQALRDVNYNKASFKFKPYRNTEIASSARYNKDNQLIYRDLLVLYKNMTTVHQILNKQYQNFVVEREKLEKQLDVLENRLRQFIQNNNRPGLLPYTYDTFDDTDKINLEETTRLFVDTKANAVHLVEEKNTSRRIIPESKLSFTFLPEGILKKEETLVGKLEDVFSETIDKTWQKRYLLKENKEVSGTLEALFEKEHMMNRIELSIYTVKPLFFDVSYTPDGINWYNLPYYEEGFEIEKTVALDFPSVSIKGLRFAFQKDEYDESLPEEEGYNYQYLFGIEHIAFYQKSYPTKGVLQTKVLSLENKPENYVIDTVQLSVDEWLPTGTQIDYEVALPSDVLDWQPIEPIERTNPQYPQTIHFHRLSRNATHELFFPEEFSIRQSEAEDLLKNGIPLYRLSNIQNDKQRFELPKIQMLEGSTRLYVGKSMWEITSYPEVDNTIPEINDFMAVKDGMETNYEKASAVKSGDIFKNKTDNQKKKYLARIAVYLDEAISLSSPLTSTESLALYLNGEELFKGQTKMNDMIHYVFQAGWNELVVVVNGQGATSVNGMSISLGFNLFSLTEKIYASSKPLREIPLFDLQYNTKRNDRSVFAKRETEKGLEILVNFGQPGLSFDLFYDYKDSLEVDEGIYLKATFTRSNGENVPTPILRKYRLEFS